MIVLKYYPQSCLLFENGPKILCNYVMSIRDTFETHKMYGQFYERWNFYWIINSYK